MIEGFVLHCQGLLLKVVFSDGVHSADESIFSPRTCFCGPFHSNRQGISRFTLIVSVFLTFKYFVPPNRKHKFLARSASLSFDLFRSVGKKPHSIKIGSRVASCWNHEASLTTAECPGFGHHPREMPEFLTPLFFPFLRFIYLSAALKHVRSAGAAFTGKRAGGRAGDPISLAFVHALNSDGAPRLLRMLCPEFLTHRFVAFAGCALTEQMGQVSH